MKRLAMQRILGVMVSISGLYYFYVHFGEGYVIQDTKLEVFCNSSFHFLAAYLILLCGALLIIVTMKPK